MTIQERLIIYKEMLHSYKNAVPVTEKGFCHYFDVVYDLSTYQDHSFEDLFSELYETKPKEMFDEEFGLWFEEGDLKSRFLCLKKAIKITKQKIKQL